MEVAYKIVYTKKALKDRKYWKLSGNKSAQRKISDLIDSIQRTPYKGIGNPEQLKHLSGIWSRRITKADRITYEVFEVKQEVLIYEMGGHYGDK